MVKILVIEDNEFIREEIVEVLLLEGFESQGFATAEAGTEAADSWLPDVIVCDVMLPGHDGYEVLHYVRNSHALAHTRFIFLSALSRAEDVMKGLNEGADAYLIKPFNSHKLLTAINEQLSLLQ